MTPTVDGGAQPGTVYLDHAATTPMVPEAIEAMAAVPRPHRQPVVAARLGPGRPGGSSRRPARRWPPPWARGRARSLFTGGGTESDNLAVKGLYWQRRSEDPARRRILASAVEHHAVMDAALWLAEHEGAVVEWLPVDAAGRVHPETLRGRDRRRPRRRSRWPP